MNRHSSISIAIAVITLHSVDTISYLRRILIYLFFKASLTSFDASQNLVQKEGPAPTVPLMAMETEVHAGTSHEMV